MNTDNASAHLAINEIYRSVQGESTFAGKPCTFIRLTGCDLRCSWCDTEYAFYEGGKMPLPEIIRQVRELNVPLVELTGGEPLLQKNVLPLMRRLCDEGFTVLIETSGSHDISGIDPRVIRIMDLKCPDSGMHERNLWSNLEHLTRRDEIKFVLASRGDYEWAREAILSHHLADLVGTVLMSPVFGRVNPDEIVAWILEDNLPVRFQLQMHKFIWPPQARGV